MPTDPNLDAVLQGILGGVGGGLAERKRQSSPEAIGQAVDVKTRMAQLDEATERLKVMRKQTEFDLRDEERKEAEFQSRQTALQNMRASGEFGTKLADLIESQTTQPSGAVQEAFLGVEGRNSGGQDTRELYEYALRQGYRGSIVDFMKETKFSPKQRETGTTKTRQPLTPVQARTAVKAKVDERIKELKGQENEWISEAEWRALKPEEKAQFKGPITSTEALNNNTPYYRPNPQVSDSIKELKAYLRDETKIKQGADSLIQIWKDTTGAPGAAAPAAAGEELDFSTMTSQQAYDLLKARKVTGMEDADPNDPELVEILRYYTENPDAFNK